MVSFLQRILLIALVLGYPLAGGAETPAFTTDRPSQSDASSLVPPGYLQFESGYTFAYDDTSNIEMTQHNLPNLVLRYGLLEPLELRLGWNGYFWNSPNPGATQKGSGDGQISAKWQIFQEADGLPETTLLSGVSLPWGQSGFSSKRIDPFIRALLTWTLPQGFSLASNLGATWTTRSEGGHKDTTADFIYTVLLGYALTPYLNVFGEFFGSVPLEEGGDRHGFDAGFAWCVLPTVQIDLSAGVGLNEAATDLFVIAGLSFRLPRIVQ